MTDDNQKKVLVTGGAGFIGSHLVDRLVNEGYDVVVMDDFSCGHKEYLRKEVKIHKVTMTDEKGVHKVVENERPSTVFHLAAQKDLRRSVGDPISDADVNIMGTLYLLASLSKLGGVRMIFPSSAAVYPIQAELPIREDVVSVPESPYGISKRAAEMYLAYYSSIYPVACVALRLSNVYGPRQCSEGAGVITLFIKSLLEGKPISINGSGEQTRDFVFVEDVVDAMIRAMKVDWCGEINIATGKEVSINKLYNMLQEVSGITTEVIRADAKEGELFRSALDADLASHTLGWHANTSFEEGLKKTVAWFKDNP